MFRSRILLLWLTALTWAGSASAADEIPATFQLLSMEAPDTDAVTARLIPTTDALVPGQTTTIGVHLSQKPGWHTYWENSGDSGLATEVKWNLPEGFVAGPLQWPTPHRYEEAGGLIAFGYADDIVLFTEVSVPADLAVGTPVVLLAEVTWLMCKELCIPGAADVELSVAVASQANAVTGRDAELIAASRARLPEPAPAEFRTYLELTAVPAGQTVHAALHADGIAADTQWTWFPRTDEDLYPAPAIAGELDGDLLLGLPVEVDELAEPGRGIPWGGILELHGAEGTRFLDLSITIPVADADSEIASASPTIFASLLGEAGAIVSTTTASRSIFYYLLMAFLGGIILNIMPCVLPVISLKVLGFVQHANEDRATVLRLGLMFAAGVLASFLALAAVVIALQAAGDQLGWGFQFQNPTFVVVMAAIVFAFGLSLFGVYEIILPITMSTGGTRGAYAESFFNGILATALATPCTAPFMGTALGFAFTQPAIGILSIFLAIGAGLALPYVLLSVNPAWLRFVPKPGMWMERFKQGMGFLLMATLIWLLWVLGQQVGTDGVVWALAFLLVLGFALWLYGAMLTLSSGTGRRMAVWALMIVLVVGSWRVFLVEPLSAEPGAVAASATHDDWETFSPAALDASVRAGNTVFVDFTAAWCWTCKVNEKTVLASSSVQDKFRENGVVKMMGDWTRRDPVITEVLRQYGRSGVPFYIVFPAGRLDDPIPLPEVITEGIVIDALEKAGPSQTVSRQASLQ